MLLEVKGRANKVLYPDSSNTLRHCPAIIIECCHIVFSPPTHRHTIGTSATVSPVTPLPYECCLVLMSLYISSPTHRHTTGTSATVSPVTPLHHASSFPKFIDCQRPPNLFLHGHFPFGLLHLVLFLIGRSDDPRCGRWAIDLDALQVTEIVEAVVSGCHRHT